MSEAGLHPGEKVLVTGAGGFIGSHLAENQARRGRQVVALDVHLDRVRHLAADGEFELLEGDVADPGLQARALEGVDTVFHLAAAHLGAGVLDAEFRRVNVGAVRSLIEAARKAGVRRYVHCSSVGVYGQIDMPPANEDSPCHPEIAYERTKLEGEQVVLEAMREHGLPAVILRPVWVYGPGCPRTEKLFRTVKKGTFVLAGRGNSLRHCVYIRDMCEAFHLAAHSEAALGQVIIVGDAGAVTVRELADEIAAQVGARRPPWLPLFALQTAALAAEALFIPLGKEPPISRRTLKFFTNNTAFDISRARRLLGFEPRYDLPAGLAETCAVLAGEPVGEGLLPHPASG